MTGIIVGNNANQPVSLRSYAISAFGNRLGGVAASLDWSRPGYVTEVLLSNGHEIV
jgi:hypothetical protein